MEEDVFERVLSSVASELKDYHFAEILEYMTLKKMIFKLSDMTETADASLEDSALGDRFEELKKDLEKRLKNIEDKVLDKVLKIFAEALLYRLWDKMMEG